MKIRVFLTMLLLPLAALMSLTIAIENFDESLTANPLILEPGAPGLPYKSVKVLLGMGETISGLSVAYQGGHHILSRELPPVQSPQPFSAQKISVTAADESIYGSAGSYPVSGYKLAGIQRQNGYDVMYLHLYPWRYDPLSRTVSWQESAEITWQTEQSEDIKEAQSRMLLKGCNGALLAEDIHNLAALESYNKSTGNLTRNLADPAEPFQMVLITSEAAGGWFSEFTDWKSDHGMEVGVFFTEDIYEEYEGANNQAKIKNFISDAYEVWSMSDTPLEYVILGGDDEIIPIRGVYINAGGTIDNNLPCDLYYSCLDNDWDGNENGVYGEVEDMVDLVPELAIARIPADNPQDVNNWFNKLTHYVDNSTYSNNIMLMLGEYLWGNPDTWGGDSMDLLLEVMDEPMQVETMYQRDGTYSEYGVTMAINEGLAFINHLGHANESFVFGQTRPSAADYYNTEYGIAYSQGCYPAAFDEATGQAGECIAENFVNRSGGMFGFIGNSRYGWGIPGQPANGPSQRYHLPFMEAVYEEDIREFGRALAYSRQVMVDEALEYAHLRWVHYELTMFGDPSIELKEPNIDFPYLYPEEPVYTDTEGDGDGAINPGETIEITLPVTADFDWANAEGVTATISFSDTAVTALNSTVNYGSIAAGQTVSSDPVIVQVPQDCSYDAYPYTVTLQAPVTGGGEFNKAYTFDFEVSLTQTNWPWFLNERLSVAPIITDLDGDGVFDILASTMSGDMYGLDIFAVEIDGFPWQTGETIENQTALGDVDADGEPEVVLATRAGNIYARNPDGSFAWEYNAGSDQLLTPVLADIDGDGLLEVVSYGMNRKLYVIDENGDNEAGFPLDLYELAFYEMAAADFDGDGAAEIAIATLSGNLHLIKADGSEIDGFPLALNAIPACGILILDNHNIVLGTNDSRLLVVSPQGSLITDKDLSSNLAAAPIAADFDEDGELEIAYTSGLGEVGICEQDGTNLTGWPLMGGYSISQPPLAVDLDNTGGIDLIWFSSTNSLFAYNNDSTEIDFSPVPLNFNDNFPASIADLDNDLDYEIVLSSSNRVLVIDSKLRKGSLAPWSTYRGNLQRTGFYGDNQLTDNLPEEVVIPQNRLLSNYPNPFNPRTMISFELAKPALIAELAIYNIRGQKVSGKTLRDISAGRHQIEWKGSDDSGNKAASGIYFYNLKVDGRNADTKRMLLLK